MKKDRNCGCEGNYPVYPAYPGMMPQGMMSMPMNQMQPMMPTQSFDIPTGNSSSIEQQLANMNSQINSLERRISNLESLVGNPTKYNNSIFRKVFVSSTFYIKFSYLSHFYCSLYS